jgi:hypothetical protein
MLLHPIHLLSLLADEPPVVSPLKIDPAVSIWLLLLIFAAAGVLIFYLYRAQRLIASPRAVIALTAIRIALLVLVLVLMLRPAWQWVRTSETTGTLWLLLDQSTSMNEKDPQSTPIERLRLASSLDLLPDTLHACQTDHTAAELWALRCEWTQLQPSPANANDKQQTVTDEISTLADTVDGWSKRLQDEVEKIQAGAVASQVRQIATESAAAGRQARSRSTFESANRDIPWRNITAELDAQVDALRNVATQEDTAFLAAHANDAAVTAALAKVAGDRRCDLAGGVLATGSGAGAGMAPVLAARNTRLIAFSQQPQVVPEGGKADLSKAIQTALEPAGNATDVADGLRFVSQQIAPGEQASVLLVSDGRVNQGGDVVEPARALAAQGAHVFTMLVGSEKIAVDAAVEPIDAPDWVYKDDTVRASAMIRLDGLAHKPVTIDFRRDGEKLAAQTITADSDHVTQRVTFTDKPTDSKSYKYEIYAEPSPGESTLANNIQSARVAVKQDKLHILVIEDQPRWEYRYLTNYLLRDKRVLLQTVLLEPAHIAGIEPPAPTMAVATNTDTTDCQILPATQDEWSGFDMIVIGDVAPESLSAEAQRNIAAAVRDRGTTLIILAGPLNMPSRYARTPLADLIPVSLGSNWSAEVLQSQLVHGFAPRPAPEGAGSLLCQLGLDEDSTAALWADAPDWYWHSEQTQAKPSATVLWQITDSKNNPNAPAAQPQTASPDSANLGNANAASDTLMAAREHALLATMSVGLGRVLYLASDSTWRFRQVDGSNLHERFWGQVIRWAAGNDLPAGGKFVRFGANKPHYVAGDNVSVTAHILGPDLTPLTGQDVQLVATTADGHEVSVTQMHDQPDLAGFYQANLPSLPAGQITLSLRGPQVEQLLNQDPTATQKTLTIAMQAQPNLEEQNINTDRSTMERIAQAGDGIMLTAADADTLAAHIPGLRKTVTTVQQAGIFTDPNDPNTRLTHWIFFGLFIALITAEWIVRKSAGML